MTEQEVQFQKIVRQNKVSYSPSTFQFRVERKYHCLQRFALWILRKLDCYAKITENFVTYEVIDQKLVIENLIKQRVELVNFYHTHDGEVLICGPNEFDELCGKSFDDPLSVSVTYMWAEPDPRDYRLPTQYTRCNLRIAVIPWMKGWLVLPKNWNKDQAYSYAAEDWES